MTKHGPVPMAYHLAQIIRYSRGKLDCVPREKNEKRQQCESDNATQFSEDKCNADLVNLPQRNPATCSGCWCWYRCAFYSTRGRACESYNFYVSDKLSTHVYQILVFLFRLMRSFSPLPPSLSGDLPAIKCGVCQALAEHLHEKVAEMRQEAPFGKV